MSTFIFLADPQQFHEPEFQTERRTIASQLNKALNKLDSMSWPTDKGLSVGGKPISKIDAVFFGGDLCQWGGDYSFADQLARNPHTYVGGSELRSIQELYVRGLDPDGLEKLKYKPVYFGLGNHDTQDETNRIPGWKGFGFFSSPTDYSRYQMYNFIAQMHTGLENLGVASEPRYGIPLANIDTDGKRTYDWKAHSFSYIVDLGPVDVIQLHWYGGCDTAGRASGLHWLKDRLEERGATRPIIIVQHASFFDCPPAESGEDWNRKRMATLLAVLEPYNIIALLTGHSHVNHFNQRISTPSSTKILHEFSVGTVACKSHDKSNWEPYSFSLVHVTATTLDVLFGRSNEQSTINWTYGISLPIPFSEQRWVSSPPANGNYFGPLDKKKYADSTHLRCPEGKIISSVGFSLAANRIAPHMAVEYPDGRDKKVVDNNGASYFPGTDGLQKFYADLNPVVCPDGWYVDELFIWRKDDANGNRIAPALRVRNQNGETKEIYDREWDSDIMGPLEHIYASSNWVDAPPKAPGKSWAVIGWGFTRVANVSNQVGVRVLFKEIPV